MYELKGKKVLVIGLGASGLAAARFLRQHEAGVTAIDEAVTPALQHQASQLRALGAQVQLGGKAAPDLPFDLAVLSPGVPARSELVRGLLRRNVPVIAELELGFQHSRCLNIAITGTNGKTTTTELVAKVLSHAHRKTLAAGNIGLPLCEVTEQSKELDFLVLEVSSFQLETIQYFRPSVAVVMNITPDHLDRYENMDEYIRAKARIFMNQQPFDWAIVQSEALAQFRSLDLPVPAKVITFSALDRAADLCLDRGLIISRLPDWKGPLLDMDQGQLRGPHNAENIMAALAVGRVLRLPLDEMVAAVKAYAPAPHRCEPAGEWNGIQFVNDSKATNLDAVRKALLAMSGGNRTEANVLLIAGGKDKNLEYHDIGPLLAQRVKHAFLLGETREKIRAAWGLFTPCSLADSLPEAVSLAAAQAGPGDVVLLSPGCSSFDQFQNYQHRGEVFREAVQRWIAHASAREAGVPFQTQAAMKR
jgi:UDP-N-acetylmuramoylalanine--D-glutamate ligase